MRTEIKKMIIAALGCTDVRPEDIDAGSPLFQNPLLGMDSIDALELVVALQKKFGVRIDDQNLARTVLYSVDTIAAFVETETARDRALS